LSKRQSVPRPAYTLFILCALLLWSCTAEKSDGERTTAARSLIGSWSAEDTTRFVFLENGEALWIFGRESIEDTFRITYDFDPGERPSHLDLSGFDRGFLEGRNLFCIMDFDSTAGFRLDCRPGLPQESGVRPGSFSQNTMLYRSDAPTESVDDDE
jgi:hypothetical protein